MLSNDHQSEASSRITSRAEPTRPAPAASISRQSSASSATEDSAKNKSKYHRPT